MPELWPHVHSQNDRFRAKFLIFSLPFQMPPGIKPSKWNRSPVCADLYSSHISLTPTLPRAKLCYRFFAKNMGTLNSTTFNKKYFALLIFRDFWHPKIQNLFKCLLCFGYKYLRNNKWYFRKPKDPLEPHEAVPFGFWIFVSFHHLKHIGGEGFRFRKSFAF